VTTLKSAYLAIKRMTKEDSSMKLADACLFRDTTKTFRKLVLLAPLSAICVLAGKYVVLALMATFSV